MEMLASFVLMLTACIALGNADSVPLLIWTEGHESVFDSMAVPLSGHTLSADDIYSGHLRDLAENSNVAIFIQDSLSMNDLTMYSNIYNDPTKPTTLKHLKDIMFTHHNLNFPKVNTPIDVVKTLEGSFSGNVKHIDGNHWTDDDLVLDSTRSNLLIVTVSSNKLVSRVDELSSTDDLIGKVTARLEALKTKYIGLYTGKSSTENKVDELHFASRRLMSTNDTKNYTETFYNVSDCVFFYATEMMLDMGPSNLLIPNVHKDIDIGNCTGLLNFTFEVYYTPDELANSNFTAFNMSMSMSLVEHSTYWFVDEWIITFATNVSTSSVPASENATEWHLETDQMTMFAVENRSYFCNSHFAKRFRQMPVGLILQNFQLQFGIHNGTFDTKYFVNTCQYYFSIPILAALMTLTLLLWIVLFGLCMLTGLRSMDRFDDPRGKPLQINASE